VALVVVGHSIPPAMEQWTTLVIGFYFGGKTATALNKN
jgi:hypothetical protein